MWWEGIGDILANGTQKVARQIGRGAEAYAHNNIKRQEHASLKLSMLNSVYFLMLLYRGKVEPLNAYQKPKEFRIYLSLTDKIYVIIYDSIIWIINLYMSLYNAD